MQKKHLNFVFIVLIALFAMGAIAGISIDGTFAELYPESWWDSTTATVLMAVGAGVALAVAAVVTVSTAGAGGPMLAAAGSWATAVGSAVGTALGVGSGAAAAGLAFLGGGTLASGGFGMAGGVFVVTALTGMTTGVVADLTIKTAVDKLTNEPYKKYEFIKVPLIQDKGSKAVQKTINRLVEIDEKFAKGKIDQQEYLKKIGAIKEDLDSLLKYACQGTAKEKGQVYDAINAAIIAYNTGDSKEVKKCVDFAGWHTESKSFLYYLSALDALAQGEYDSAYKKLQITLGREPSALQPYLLYTMALNDNKKYKKAIDVATRGLELIDDESYHLLYSRGLSEYYMASYASAAKDFVIAFKNVSNNIIEVDTAMMAAISYLKAGDRENGWKWYKKALDKVDGVDSKDEDVQKTEIKTRWSCMVNEDIMTEKCIAVRS